MSWIYVYMYCAIPPVQLKSKIFYQHGLILIPAWRSNYILYKVWDEIFYSSPNFTGHMFTVSTLGSKLIHISNKRGPYLMYSDITSKHRMHDIWNFSKLQVLWPKQEVYPHVFIVNILYPAQHTRSFRKIDVTEFVEEHGAGNKILTMNTSGWFLRQYWWSSWILSSILMNKLAFKKNENGFTTRKHTTFLTQGDTFTNMVKL